MIREIKIKFILLSMTMLFILLFCIVAGMNAINYNTIVARADSTLTLLSGNRGAFPDFKDKHMPRHMTPETPYETRYFSVLLDKDNRVIQADTNRIKAIDTKEAIEYALAAAATNKTKGFIGQYRFQSCPEQNYIRIIFLNWEKELNSFRNFFIISIGMALGGYIAFFFAILFFSQRMIRPVTESYEKQKRFITDAGHEIKTPLAIIQADTDVLEMDFGESEWLDDIKRQTKRLTMLTNDLVLLSRMEEAESNLQMTLLTFSDLVSEAAASFAALIQTQNKVFRCAIEPGISLTGDEKSIRRLVNILMDNALKYSPSQGLISLSVKKQGKQVCLTVCNTTQNPISKDELHMMFERFYRIDSSRNAQTGGFGIGLSVAKAIVTAHRGRIRAATRDRNLLEINILFPNS
ncbi:MAG: sensor histidine kinase [Lachnospiraceae bacterium]